MSLTPLRLSATLVSLSVFALVGCSSTTSASSTATTSASTTSTASATTSSSTSTDQAAVVKTAVEKATAFLGLLSTDARASAVFAYDALSTKEGSWSNFPVGIFKDRLGARLGDLTAEQRTAALAVVDSLLSEQGSEQVKEILMADDYLGDNSTGNQATEWSSDNYFLAFYGEPSTSSAWTMQFGGHHLAVHISVGGGTVSVSPLFTGVEPTTFTVDGTTYSPMVEEVDAVFGFLGGLTSAQQTTAKLAGSYDDLVMGPGSDTGYPSAAEGIAYSDLTDAQKAQVKEIIGLWVKDADATLTDDLMGTYEEQLAQTKIGWSGSTDKTGESAYLRIDGPRVWIEYLNAPGVGTTEVHYHTVYRDKTVDYGTGAS